MKSDVFNYSYQYMNWHSDTPESRECDINSAKCFCDAHGLYPKSRDAQVLEIGCGMGRFLLMLQNSGYENLRGIDIDKSQIEIAKHENLNVSLDDTVEFLTLASEKYDVIYAFDVLEHIDKEKQLQLLRMMFDRTIDGGFVAFSVPNGLAPLAGYYRYTDFTHTVSYTAQAMNFLLNNAGFHYTAVRPQSQEPKSVQDLKLPWARLYRTEFGLNDFILTPNIIVIAFKEKEVLDNYLKNAPEIHNDYAEPVDATANPEIISRIKKICINTLCGFIPMRKTRHKIRNFLRTHC